ncbi:MAG: HPr family phosphocarrier protein [Eubacteriales bacterium]|nr:HPr family phosphocarrier protein [Eubacteriales bacterium]
MVSKTVVIRDEDGLHLRPAGALVGEANRFRSKIRMQYGEHELNCKSLMSLLAFPVCPGAEVTVRCEGEDEEEALRGIVEFLENLRG